jgi:hypothetical protein
MYKKNYQGLLLWDLEVKNKVETFIKELKTVTEKNGNSRAEQYTEFNMSKNGIL